MIVADKAPSLEKLEHYIDAEALEAMGVPAAAGHTPADGLRPPSLGAIASRENIHFYLMAFARASQIPMSGTKKEGIVRQTLPRGRRLDRRARLSRARRANTSESTSTSSSPAGPTARTGRSPATSAPSRPPSKTSSTSTSESSCPIPECEPRQDQEVDHSEAKATIVTDPPAEVCSEQIAPRLPG